MDAPPVSVVLPFHGTPAEADRALDAVGAIGLRPGDEVIVVDNTGAGVVRERPGVTVVAAGAQSSSYYARNAGAAQARGEWLLFVDADCRPRPDVLERYREHPVGDDVGAVVGEVEGVAGQDALVARYARSRGHLGQRMHWEFPFRPWGVTANLLVRRAAWEDVGGFQEGIRSGGDTEFSWRLQDAGWSLAFCPEAVVEHEHRDSVRSLARQAARYAAGRAWVMRRYPGSLERPRLVRRLVRCAAGVVAWTLTGRFERARFKALDAVYVVSEWAAFALSNTPPRATPPRGEGTIVAVAGVFPDRQRPEVVTAAGGLAPLRVEATARPVRVDRAAARALPVAYAEDDGVVRRLAAIASIAVRRPVPAWHHRRRLYAEATTARRVRASGAVGLRAVEAAGEARVPALRALAGLGDG